MSICHSLTAPTKRCILLRCVRALAEEINTVTGSGRHQSVASGIGVVKLIYDFASYSVGLAH